MKDQAADAAGVGGLIRLAYTLTAS